jgi:GNAT superfamily N-acetyltransferase
VTNLMHCYSSEEARKKAKFKLLHEDGITAIRSDILPGFSLNRALGFTEINDEVLNKIEEFYSGRTGKYALQIPPYILNDEKINLLNSRGYNYANSWVTFYRDSSPVISRGTDLMIKEIGKEEAGTFAHILNDVFGFPHEFDDIAASAVGAKEWIIYMAYDNEKPAGSAGICVVGDTAYLSYANVLPEYRRRGAQGKLLSKRIDAARERGAKWIVVDTAETSDEHPNPSYWNMLRHGFRLLYHRPNYVKIQ